MYKDFFFFDIETVSKYNTFFNFKLEDERGAELFLKKYEKMKLFEKDWDLPIDQVYEQKASLIPEYGRIVCMSFGMFSNDKKTIMTIIEDDEDKLIERIQKIFDRASKAKKFLYGFSVKSFDIPWIVKKMYKYNVDVPRCLNFNGLKPWEISVTDLIDTWKGTGRNTSTLEEIVYDLGLPQGKTISSKDIHEYYWFKKDKTSIIAKCENDISDMINIAERLSL
jgi:predicted PolB exonuclease-like 3'-5' exonuclease